MFWLRAIAFASSVGLLAGCAVGPDYKKPTLPLMDEYSQHAHNQVDRNKQGVVDDPALVHWWAAFNDPTLTHYVRLALAQNLNLSMARARVVQAKGMLSGATANLLPSASVSGQGTRAYQSVETQLGRVLDTIPTYERYNNLYEANLTASWDLDLFGGLKRARQAALADYQASQAGVIATRLAVAAQTADTYLTILGLQQRLKIAKRQVEIQQDILALTQKLSDHGLAPEAETDQQAAQLAQNRSRVPTLRNALTQATNGLDVLLGAPIGTHMPDIAVNHAIPIAPRFGDMGSPRALLTRRPDLIMAQRRLMAANARIGAAIAEYYPKISLTGLIGTATTISSGNLFSQGATQGLGSVGLRWRLFDFGRINAQIKVARGREAEMLASYRQTALQATQDVENAVSALATRREHTQQLSDSVAAIERAKTAREKAYNRGVSSRFDVLQIEARLMSVRDAETQARVGTAQAAVATYRSLGGGWDYRQVLSQDALATRK